MTFEYPLERLFVGEKEIIKMIGRKREKKNLLFSHGVV